MPVRFAVAQAQAPVVLDPVGGLLGLPAGTAQKVRAALCEGFQLARNDLARRQEAERREVFEAQLVGGLAAAVLGRAADLGLDLTSLHALLVAAHPRTRPLNYIVEVVGVGAFAAHTTSYQHEVSDIAGQELVIYDWHPTGLSPITTPHLRVPASGSIVLDQRPGSPLEGARTHLGSLHLPTAHIGLAAIVYMLVREFRVDPVRPDWEPVLHGA